MRLVVIGANGLVGRRLLSLLHEDPCFQNVPCVALGSQKSAGTQMTVSNSEVLTINNAEHFTFLPDDFVFSATDSHAAKVHVPKALAAGAHVIDKSTAFRNNAPLIVPEINGHILDSKPKLVCSPNCVAIPLALSLHLLHQEFTLKTLVVSTYQSVSGVGIQGMDTLFAETKALLMASAPDTKNSPFLQQMAWNVLPQIGDLDAKGISEEENKAITECQALLQANIPISMTCVRVPVLIGHMLAVTVDFDKEIGIVEAQNILENTEGVLVSRNLTTPLSIVGESGVYITRLRQSAPRQLSFCILCDNLLKGASLNAVQIAQAMQKMKS